MRIIRRTLAAVLAACTGLLSLSACSIRITTDSSGNAAESGATTAETPDLTEITNTTVSTELSVSSSSEITTWYTSTTMTDFTGFPDPDGNGELYLMPSLVGMDYQYAVRVYGSILDIKIIGSEYSSFDKDVIISQDIMQNDPIKKGTKVNVKISLGRNASYVTMPYFFGMQWDSAKETAEELGLTVVRKDAESGAPAGSVIAQSVGAGESVPPGTKVTLTVSNGSMTERTVIISFLPPSGARGLFRIAMFENGAEKGSTDTFNTEYVPFGVKLTVQGTGTKDMEAMLFNEVTGAKAKIGNYRVNFEDDYYTPLSYDIYGAFERVGAFPASTVTTPPAHSTTAEPPSATTATVLPGNGW